MKLRYPFLDNVINITPEVVNVLQIADTALFSKTVQSFHALVNKIDPIINITLFDELTDKQIDFSKIDLILNPLLIDLNSRRINSAILGRFKSTLKCDVMLAEQIQTIATSLQRLLEDSLIEVSVPLLYDTEWDATKIVKALDIKADNDVIDIKELLFKYIALISEFDIAPLCVFINLDDYFTSEQMEEIYNELLLRQVPSLLVSHSCEYPKKNPLVRTNYIDSDFVSFVL